MRLNLLMSVGLSRGYLEWDVKSDPEPYIAVGNNEKLVKNYATLYLVLEDCI